MVSPPVVGVLGAGGFIGSRIVEVFHLERITSVRPIVRSAAHLARSARFALDGRIADGFDRAALRAAFDGCDVVVHAIAGDRKTILGTLEPVYEAARDAGVRRMIYLSSAAVHGQVPAPGTDERSPLSTRQPIAYNVSKVLAEQALLKLRSRCEVEVVVLRPGIVFGPRSRWTGNLADELLGGQACLIDGGSGICNCIYVDNLVHAIRLAMTAKRADREAFLLGERETVTWCELYRPVAEALGLEIEKIPSGNGVMVEERPEAGAVARRARQWGRAGLPWLPAPLRQRVRAFSAAWRASSSVSSPGESSQQLGAFVTLEITLLHRCGYKLPWTKAQTVLGYEPQVSFDEACRRSVAWLAFAGYPVVDQAP